MLVSRLALIAALWGTRPDDMRLRGLLRQLPDTLRLLRRPAADGTVPRGVWVRLWLLLGHRALPIDLAPDFVPVLGYADDAVVVALVLRSVMRRAGPDTVSPHWPGTSRGLGGAAPRGPIAGLRRLRRPIRCLA